MHKTGLVSQALPAHNFATMADSQAPVARPESASNVMTRIRWVICGLLFFSTTINYMDRQVISYLKEFFCTPADKGGFGWSNTDFANLTSAFTAFYAGMTIGAGWIIDRIGTKLGLAISLIVWSIFGMLNAFVGRLVLAHIVVRSAFGSLLDLRPVAQQDGHPEMQRPKLPRRLDHARFRAFRKHNSLRMPLELVDDRANKSHG